MILRVLGTTAVCAVCLFSNGSALAAPDANACIDANESAQKLRRQSRLLDARAMAISCGQASCPDIVAKDCLAILEAIDRDLPSLSFSVVGPDGEAMADAQVSVDGRVVRRRLDGKALQVDPGEHTVLFEVAGQKPVKKTVMVAEGMKGHVVQISFAIDGPPKSAPLTKPEPRSFTFPIVISGIGLATVGAGVVVGAVGMGERNNLAHTCGTNCSEQAIAPVRTKLNAADVCFGIGGGIVLVGVTVALTNLGGKRESNRSTATLSVVPTPGGGMFGIAGHF